MNSTTLTVWIICGLIAAAVYRSKGRSMLIAFVAGVLLGPIALLLALVSGKSATGLAKQQEKNEVQLLKSGKMKQCPSCAELIKPDAKICKHCGQPVPA